MTRLFAFLIMFFSCGLMFAQCGSGDCIAFIRGDFNGDGAIDPLDLNLLGQYVYYGSPGPVTGDAADINDNGILREWDDYNALQQYLTFLQPLAPPFNEPGLDETPDNINYMCDIYNSSDDHRICKFDTIVNASWNSPVDSLPPWSEGQSVLVTDIGVAGVSDSIGAMYMLSHFIDNSPDIANAGDLHGGFTQELYQPFRIRQLKAKDSQNNCAVSIKYRGGVLCGVSLEPANPMIGPGLLPCTGTEDRVEFNFETSVGTTKPQIVVVVEGYPTDNYLYFDAFNDGGDGTGTRSSDTGDLHYSFSGYECDEFVLGPTTFPFLREMKVYGTITGYEIAQQLCSEYPNQYTDNSYVVVKGFGFTNMILKHEALRGGNPVYWSAAPGAFPRVRINPPVWVYNGHTSVPNDWR